MMDALSKWPQWKLRALHRVAKTRGRAFFADPKMMAGLRHLKNGRVS